MKIQGRLMQAHFIEIQQVFLKKKGLILFQQSSKYTLISYLHIHIIL